MTWPRAATVWNSFGEVWLELWADVTAWKLPAFGVNLASRPRPVKVYLLVNKHETESHDIALGFPPSLPPEFHRKSG